MGIADLFSKRMKKERGDVPDVYVYDVLPNELRVQVTYILRDLFGGPDEYARPNIYQTAGVYRELVETLCREYGILRLVEDQLDFTRDYLVEFCAFILAQSRAERVIDAIELSFRFANTVLRRTSIMHRPTPDKDVTESITELNHRFLENGVGFAFEGNSIIRLDSQLIHREVVKPALQLISCRAYAGVQDEFLRAHEHYRKGNVKESLNDCLKAFESTLKCICDNRGWKYSPKDTSSQLLNIIFSNNLIDPYWQNEMSALRAVLEGGVPVARNRLAGHGQGQEPRQVPQHIAAYALHMTAAAIVFLIQAERGT